MKEYIFDYIPAKKSNYKHLPKVDLIANEDREFDSIIIVPEKHKHDSGYMCMSFAGVQGCMAVCLMGGSSDVLHLDGIGGYGDWWKGTGSKVPEKVQPKAWCIDCLPCGYLRVFVPQGKITIGNMLSDFDIYAQVGAL